ncbi:hypothetical protein GEMRC1_011055 [Eukaryota sp. GEM-RC1]
MPSSHLNPPFCQSVLLKRNRRKQLANTELVLKEHFPKPLEFLQPHSPTGNDSSSSFETPPVKPKDEHLPSSLPNSISSSLFSQYIPPTWFFMSFSELVFACLRFYHIPLTISFIQSAVEPINLLNKSSFAVRPLTSIPNRIRYITEALHKTKTQCQLSVVTTTTKMVKHFSDQLELLLVNVLDVISPKTSNYPQHILSLTFRNPPGYTPQPPLSDLLESEASTFNWKTETPPRSIPKITPKSVPLSEDETDFPPSALIGRPIIKQRLRLEEKELRRKERLAELGNDSGVKPIKKKREGHNNREVDELIRRTQKFNQTDMYLRGIKLVEELLSVPVVYEFLHDLDERNYSNISEILKYYGDPLSVSDMLKRVRKSTRGSNLPIKKSNVENFIFGDDLDLTK